MRNGFVLMRIPIYSGNKEKVPGFYKGFPGTVSQI